MSVLKVLSLGAGVQSTTLAIMAARGDLETPDCAIFADTGWEPEAVYEHLGWLETVLPFPVHRVRRDGLDLGQFAVAIATEPVTRSAMPPWFTSTPGVMLPKQCSKEFKTRVIQRKIRELLGIKPRQQGPKGIAVEQWLGISIDEAHRMKPSELRYVSNRWPLIEFGMNRRACLRYLEERQYQPPPKSSCVFCPFRGDAQWREMRDNAPADWQKAVEIDRAIRPGFLGMDGQAYVHTQRRPLDQVDLSTWVERGQGDLFGEECDGVCGV